MKILIASTKELCYFSGSFFLDRIQEVLERKNVEVVRLDFDENEADYSLLETVMGKTFDAVLDVNSRLPYLIDDRGKRVLNEINAPFINYILDHPLYHHPGLVFPIERYYTLGIDRFHVDYMKKYYPYIRDAKLLPIAGTKAFCGAPFEEREKGILFTGTYLKDEELDEKILALRNQINNATYQLALDLWDAWQDTTKPIEDCLLDLLKKYSGAKTEEEVDAYIQDFYEMSGFAELLNCMFLVDQKKRNQKREVVLEQLSDATYPLVVVGEGWENSAIASNERIRFLPARSMVASVQLMGRYRFVLDINPMFACGLHDRVTSAWASGSVCISDMSLMFDNDIQDAVNVISYSEKGLNKLKDRLDSMTTDDLCIIAKNGLELAERKFSWDNHGQELIRFIEQINTK